jgi:hypothetical protein
MGSMRSRWVLTVCVFAFAASLSGGEAQTRYPHELQGFRFYGKYVAPLLPGVSSQDAVRKVLGDISGVKRNGWIISATYTMKSGPISNPVLGPLAEIMIRPEGTIPMGGVRFASFSHCHASVSEINISFDVYSDTYGLQYWLHEEDSEWGKKGDLYRIVYGPRRRPFGPRTYC